LVINWQNLSRLVFLVGLVAHFSSVDVLAQATPPWQAAPQIRQKLLEAQKELLAAARAEDPAAHYQAAAMHIDKATAQYEEALQTEVAAVAPEADQAIRQALATAREAALTGEAAILAAARGQVWANLLWGSYEATLMALTQGQTDSASAWLQLREYRQATRVTVIEDVSTRVMTALKAGEIEAAEASTVIGNDLRDAYFFRLREALNQLEGASGNKFASRAAEWTGQARGYANILRADMTTKLGDETTSKLASILADLEQAVLKEDWPAVGTALEVARSILASYLPVELDAAQVAKRGQLLYLFTDLVYIEYKDGVRNGQITILIEYQRPIQRQQPGVDLERPHRHRFQQPGPGLSGVGHGHAYVNRYGHAGADRHRHPHSPHGDGHTRADGYRHLDPRGNSDRNIHAVIWSRPPLQRGLIFFYCPEGKNS
jgi:hypothetical protein